MVPSDSWMGILVDLTKCNGCRQCEAACQEAAGFDAPTKEELLDDSVFSEYRRPAPNRYTTVNRFYVGGEGASVAPVYAKANCMHCNDPACASACLVGAMRKEPNGAVSYDAGKCMGCRYCMIACPFEMPTYEYDNTWTPRVRKCTLCFDKEHTDRNEPPACVRVCPKQCLVYGRRSELLAQAHARIERYPEVYIDHIYGEYEAGGTSWLYISGVPFENLKFARLDPQAPPRLAEAIQHGVFNHFVPPLAWCGVLALAMWLTRTEPQQHPETVTPERQSGTESTAFDAMVDAPELESANV